MTKAEERVAPTGRISAQCTQNVHSQCMCLLSISPAGMAEVFECKAAWWSAS